MPTPVRPDRAQQSRGPWNKWGDPHGGGQPFMPRKPLYCEHVQVDWVLQQAPCLNRRDAEAAHMTIWAARRGRGVSARRARRCSRQRRRRAKPSRRWPWTSRGVQPEVRRSWTWSAAWPGPTASRTRLEFACTQALPCRLARAKGARANLIQKAGQAGQPLHGLVQEFHDGGDHADSAEHGDDIPADDVNLHVRHFGAKVRL